MNHPHEAVIRGTLDVERKHCVNAYTAKYRYVYLTWHNFAIRFSWERVNITFIYCIWQYEIASYNAILEENKTENVCCYMSKVLI